VHQTARPARTAPAAPRRPPDWAELGLALAAFAVLAVVALTKAPRLVEPDDYAYQASIIALAHGHLTLSDTQYHALLHYLQHLDHRRSPVIPEWHRTAAGRWISEKGPGYPFLAVAFYRLRLIRLVPLAYGLLGCAGLYLGARRWLRRRFAGATTVALYCSSGAAALFAWRDYLPTFTDASLIAAGTGALLWAVLADDARPRRRIIAGLLAFAALDAATLARYTDILVLAAAILAVVAARLLRSIPAAALWWWLGSVAAFAAALLLADTLVYGAPAATGYRPGQINFTLASVWPNLHVMPGYLVEAMPVLVPAVITCGWIAVRAVRSWIGRSQASRSQAGRSQGSRSEHDGSGAGRSGADRSGAGRDLAVAAALALSWLSVWSLYLGYTWTAAAGQPGPHGLGPLHGSALMFVRFYVPGLGAMALLAAWALIRLPRWALVTAVAALYGLGYWSCTDLAHFRLPGAGTRMPVQESYYYPRSRSRG
jgi:hypothetical protein